MLRLAPIRLPNRNAAEPAGSLTAPAVRTNGFTLIEVLLTILIIGLGAMIVVLNLPNTQRFDNGAQGNAERFLQQMQHAREQALLRNYVYGIEFEDDRYRFYRWYENSWQLQTEPPLAPVTLLEPFYFELQMGDFRLLDNMSEGRDAVFGRDERADNREEDLPRPTVLIFESTEFVPFSIEFGQRDAANAGVLVNGRSGIQLQLEEGPQW